MLALRLTVCLRILGSDSASGYLNTEYTVAGCHHRAGLSWVCCGHGLPNLSFLLQTASLQMVDSVSGETA